MSLYTVEVLWRVPQMTKRQKDARTTFAVVAECVEAALNKADAFQSRGAVTVTGSKILNESLEGILAVR